MAGHKSKIFIRMAERRVAKAAGLLAEAARLLDLVSATQAARTIRSAAQEATQALDIGASDHG